MWYMYSGIAGKGNRNRFTAGTMKKFIPSINVVHPIIGDENMKVDNSTEYILGKDFEIEYDWIYYPHKSSAALVIKDDASFIKNRIKKQLLFVPFS